MATLDLGGLATRLEGLGLGPIPQFSEVCGLHILHSLKRSSQFGRLGPYRRTPWSE